MKKNQTITNQQGFSAVILVLLVATLAVSAFAVYKYKVQPTYMNSYDYVANGNTAPSTFEVLPESDTTPEEINNEVVEELDSLILEVDQELENLDDLNF